jgi:hypothetical protein
MSKKPKTPSWHVRVGKERIRLQQQPAVTPQMKAIARARYYEAVKRMNAKKEEK